MKPVPLLKSWRDYPALVLASLGLVSGILSAVVGFEVRVDVLDWPGACSSSPPK